MDVIEKARMKEGLDESLGMHALKTQNGWSKWMQTMDLKFIQNALYQKWYRRRPNDERDAWKTQVQWRPIRGQSGVTDAYRGEEA